MAKVSSGAVPIPLTTFIGRGDELDRLAALAAEHRLVTLVGPGGCGKTRLLLEHLTRRPPSLEVAVDLGPLADPAGVLALVLERARGPAEAPGDPVDQLASRLSASPTTLVLDTCEHVLDAAAHLVATLLGRLPGLRVLATSREPLGVPGEAVYRVPSMSLPTTGDAADVVESDAVALLVARARLVRPDFAADDDPRAIVEVCRRLDGLPLALELAAARLAVLSPAQLAASLDDRFRILTGGSRVVLPRSRTLEASVAWSFELLSDEEQRALIALSVFRGTFPMTAGVAVVAGAVDEADAFATIDRLVHKSLIQAEPADPETRLRLLDTVAAFATGTGSAHAPELLAAARDRHLAWHTVECTRLGELVDRGRPDEALKRLQDLHADILAALEHAEGVADHRADAAVALWHICGSLTFSWATTGRFAEARRWFERAAAHPAPEATVQLPAWWGAAHVALYGGDLELAVQAVSRAEAMAETIGDDRYLGRALNTRATIELFADADRAEALHERAVDLAERSNDAWCFADALQASAYGDLFTLRLERAAAKLDRARPAAERLDHPLLLAWDRAGQGLLEGLRGGVTAATRHLEDARCELARLHDPNIALYIDLGSAVAGARAAGPGPQVEPLTIAVAEAERVGAAVALPLAVPQLAQLLLSDGDASAAALLLDRWRDLLVALLPRSAWRLHLLDAQVAVARGDRAGVDDELSRAVTAASEHTTPAQRATALATAGAVWLAVGDPARAETPLIDAVGPLHDAGLAPPLIDALEALASVRTTGAAAGEAARLRGAAARLRADFGIVHTDLEHLVTPTDATDHADDEAWRAGHTAALADVVTSVGRARGRRGRPTVGWEALTPTEAHVVDLAARGLANAEIATQLFMSSETVKSHLSRAYDKLGVRNRTALAAAYHHRPGR